MKIFNLACLSSKGTLFFLKRICKHKGGIFFFAFIAISLSESFGQIEWAVRATDPQTEVAFQFDQLLGEPNSYLEEKRSDFAWTAYFEKIGDTKEVLIQFDKAIPVRKIFVVENFGIGLKDIYLIDEGGEERAKYSINQNFDFALNIISKISHVTLYEPTEYKVKFLRLVVYEPFSDSEVCQIDAVGISSEDVHYLFPPREIIARRQLRAQYPFTLNYQILDSDNNEPIVGAAVVITDLVSQSADTVYTDTDGRVVQHLKHSKYSVDVTTEGYFVSNEYKFSTLQYESDKVIGQTNKMRRFQPGKSFVFYGLFKNLTSTELTERDIQILDKMLRTLKANPYSVVALRMHTDARGNDEYNLRITAARAEAIAQFLESEGIPRRRLVPEGLGETELTNECGNGVLCDSEKHLANRRLVVEVVDYLN